jgi:hypothetical protein
MPALPIEIIEYMIDYLSDDSVALKACSLTCRSWSPRARNNLFTGLRVPHYPSSQLQSLPSASIPFHAVRVMTIIGSSVKLFALLEPHWSILQNLTNLRICGFMYGILDHYLLLFLVNFPIMESLTIWGCQLHASDTIIHVIQSCPQLSRLELRQITIKSYMYAAPIPGARPCGTCISINWTAPSKISSRIYSSRSSHYICGLVTFRTRMPLMR